MLAIRVLENSTYNSLKLTFLKGIIGKMNIERAEVIMGTEANKDELKAKDFYHEAMNATTANDLVIIVETKDDGLLDEIVAQADDILSEYLSKRKARPKGQPSAFRGLERYLSIREVKSAFFKRDFTDERLMGRIQSIFSSSFNVLFQEKLLNFSTVGMPASPHSCVLEEQTIQRLVKNGRTGNLVKLEGEVVTFYSRGAVFSVDLSEVPEVDLRIPKFDLNRTDIAETNLYQVLNQMTFSGEMGLKVEGAVLESIQVLENIADAKESVIQQAVNHLIGRGDGLTPSGDDILLGYGMVRQVFVLEDRFMKILKCGLKERSTTEVSVAYHESLLAGYVNSLFLGLLTSIELDDLDTTRKIAALITRYGHTSGYDTLFGIYLGLLSFIIEED